MDAAPILHSASLHVVVVFTCVCEQAKLLVLTGVSDVKTCPDCRRRYMVAAVTHEPNPEGMFETNVKVGLINELAAAVQRPLEIRRVRS